VREAVEDDSFRDFYQATYGRTVALVAAVLGDRHEAEDITQEAFARAFARWPKLSGYDVPEAWVRRVAMRLAVDAFRRLQRALRVSRRLSAGKRGEAGESDRLLSSTVLSAALMRVPLRQREALVLHYLIGLPVERIARDCGLPAGTVKTRIAAGRRRLERELGEHPEEVCDAR